MGRGGKIRRRKLSQLKKTIEYTYSFNVDEQLEYMYQKFKTSLDECNQLIYKLSSKNAENCDLKYQRECLRTENCSLKSQLNLTQDKLEQTIS
jgi:FtsZ-binding cell division protein ZapB